MAIYIYIYILYIYIIYGYGYCLFVLFFYTNNILMYLYVLLKKRTHLKNVSIVFA